MTTDDDRRRVAELLGREPMGTFAVVVRDDDGDPVVIENQPLLADGTPMPTRFWLVGRTAGRRVAELESAGGVRDAESAVDPAELADAHRRYAEQRDALIDPSHDGPRPDGGVGGTRRGVKCLHAHYAWFLAGGDDPVGRWIDTQLNRVTVTVDHAITVAGPHGSLTLEPTTDTLLTRHLNRCDPPAPEDLTNAIAEVRDDLDDRRRGITATVAEITVDGAGGELLARLETGTSAPGDVAITRDTLEEIFRLVATEARHERADEPGLDPDDSDAVLAAATAAVAVVRSLDVNRIVLRGPRR